MSNKTMQLFLILAAFLLLYLSSTTLTGIPGIICLVLALSMTLIALIKMIQNFRK